MGIGIPVPPPPPPWASPLEEARYNARWRKKQLTVDQAWLLRDDEQGERNKKRRMDWETRFKVLGRRPIDEQRGY